MKQSKVILNYPSKTALKEAIRVELGLHPLGVVFESVGSRRRLSRSPAT